MKMLFAKGSPLIFRLIVACCVAILLMLLDARYHAFKTVRYYLDTLVSPLYYISNSPRSSFDSLYEKSKTRDELLIDNQHLRNELLLKQSDLLLLENLRHENDRLRELLDSPLRNDEHKMAAQVLLADTYPYAFQLVINKGKDHGIYIGQPVVDEKGIIGQIYATAEKTSRAIMICDYQHAIPVQILRNDTSMVAVGNGCDQDLLLEFLPNNLDIIEGDILVTSGLDGRFPEGYPVATVISIQRDLEHANLVIRARPTAELKRPRYLLLLWTEERSRQNTDLINNKTTESFGDGNNAQ